MTKKDFTAIAITLDANRAPLALVEDFADMLEDSNPLFDRQKFIVAATIELRATMSRDHRHLARIIAGA